MWFCSTVPAIKLAKIGYDLSKLDRRKSQSNEPKNPSCKRATERVTEATLSGCGSFRKEVIQPQVLLQLPCYDFTPIMNHTVVTCVPCGFAQPLLVQPTFVM